MESPPEDADDQLVKLMLIKQQIGVANMLELLENITSKCFVKCVLQPTHQLTPSETNCINLCTDRFLDAYRHCADAYGHRLHSQRERYQSKDRGKEGRQGHQN